MKIVKKILDKADYKNELPVNLKEKDRWLFQTHVNTYLHEIKIYSGKNVLLLPEHILMKKQKIWREELTNHYLKNKTYVIKRLIKAFLRGTIKLKGKYVLITDDWSASYFHWTADALQRLYLIKDEMKEYTLLIPEYFKKYSYITESLSMFNARVHFFPTDKNLRIEELLVPSPAGGSGIFNYEVIRGLSCYLKDHKKINEQQTPAYHKIYISRGKALKRKILNEEEVISILMQLNFEIVYMEDIGFIEQIKLLSNCKYLVSLHGAGLTNELFLPASANVLEIRHPKDHLNNCYYTLAAALNLKYHYFLGDATDDDPHSSDITIDPSSFQKSISQFLLSE